MTRYLSQKNPSGQEEDPFQAIILNENDYNAYDSQEPSCKQTLCHNEGI